MGTASELVIGIQVGVGLRAAVICPYVGIMYDRMTIYGYGHQPRSGLGLGLGGVRWMPAVCAVADSPFRNECFRWYAVGLRVGLY